MSDQKMIEEQDKTFVAEDADQPMPPIDTVAYNELRSCADLFRMYESKKLELQPDFQRDAVWKLDGQTRFIDSLVKQLPIPSMCFSFDYKTQKWKVIDGLQRMTAIVKFLGNDSWKLSDLSDTHPSLRNSLNISLRDGNDDEKRIFEMVKDFSIPITVIRCDYSKAHHMRYLFTIFHRLNSGGVRLNNQEIRNCIYSGVFNKMLKDVNAECKDWSFITKRIWGSMERFRSVEVLLRVLALSNKWNDYDGNLAKFLNDYMYSMMLEDKDNVEVIKNDLEVTISRARQILETEPKGKQPLTKIEAILVGLYVNRDGIKNKNQQEILDNFEKLKQVDSFATGFRFAVTSAENVKSRVGAAITAFA